MKKIFGVVVVIALVLLAGCSGTTSSSDRTPTEAVGEETQTPTETGGTDTKSPSKTKPTAEPQTSATSNSKVTKVTTATANTEPTETPASGTNHTVTVYDVMDGGDVIIVEFDNGSQRSVKLHGVEAPETSTSEITPEAFDMPATDQGRNWLYRWGHKAREYRKTQLDDERVKIVVQGHTATGTQQVYLYYGNDQATLYNMNLLEKGYARATETAHPLSDEFVDAEDATREDSKGIWSFNESQSDLSIR